MLRGIFGTHVAHLLRRLRRLANHYGADPTFVFTSATIGNPKELAEHILEEKAALVDDNGARRPKVEAAYLAFLAALEQQLSPQRLDGFRRDGTDHANRVVL